jgi:hypothetical protein
MVKEMTMYSVVCDNCGIDVNENSEYAAWSDKSHAEDIALESDWLKQEDKHYCQDCFSYDDEENVIITPIT